MYSKFGKTVIRWIYIFIIYALLGFLTYLLLDSLLQNPGHSPTGYSSQLWWSYCRKIFFVTIGSSLILQLIWNVTAFFLRYANEGRSVNAFNLLFMLLHIGMCVGIVFLMLSNTRDGLNYVMGYFESSYLFSHFTPVLVTVPFVLCSRLLTPVNVAYRFPVLNKLRRKLPLL
jgi:hypothetical protein